MYNTTANKNVWIEQPCPSQTKRTYYYSDGTTLTKEGGTVSWRNNNEGNLRPGSLSSNRIGVDKKNFAVFATPEDGYNAKRNLLFTSNSYCNLTLKQAIAKYAPRSDNNNPTQYANYIITKCNIVDKQMNKYSSDEQTRIMNAMKIQEGYKVGSIIKGTHKTQYKQNADNTSAEYNKQSAVSYNKGLQYNKNKWKLIQEKLNTLTYDNLIPDGIPGTLTADSIYKFQSNNLMDKLDGKLGPNTRKVLGI